MSLGWDESWKDKLGSCGENVFIGHHVLFAYPEKVFLADNVRIDPFTLVTTGLNVGKNVQICAYAMLGGGGEHTIEMGDWTFIGYGSKLFCASEDYSGDFGPVNDFWGSNKAVRRDIKLADYSGIASEVMLMPGVELPEGCTIGAKSFVYSSEGLQEWSVYIGNPPTFRKERNRRKVLDLSQDPEWLKSHA